MAHEQHGFRLVGSRWAWTIRPSSWSANAHPACAQRGVVLRSACPCLYRVYDLSTCDLRMGVTCGLPTSTLFPAPVQSLDN